MAESQQPASDDLGEFFAEGFDTIESMRAERDRYEEALRRIAAYEPPVDEDGIVLVSLQPLKTIAREALDGE